MSTGRLLLLEPRGPERLYFPAFPVLMFENGRRGLHENIQPL